MLLLIQERKEKVEQEQQRLGNEQLESAPDDWKERLSALELQLQQSKEQVSLQNAQMTQVNSLREAATVCRNMLTLREGEVELLKQQLASSESKVEAFKERYQLQKALIMEEVRQQAHNFAGAQLLLVKWKELAVQWAQAEGAEDVVLPQDDRLEGAEQLARQMRKMFLQRLEAAKELETVKETNHSLMKSLAQHGNRLSTVTSELDKTWTWLSRLKLLHGQLQTDESIMREELREKRQLLERLKEQLEELKVQKQKKDAKRRKLEPHSSVE